MKKSVWPNQGHPVTEAFVDEVARAFSSQDCVFIVLGCETGIETPDTVMKNEVVRLVVPKHAAVKVFQDLAMAASELVQDKTENSHLFVEPAIEREVRLGSPLSFSQ